MAAKVETDRLVTREEDTHSWASRNKEEEKLKRKRDEKDAELSQLKKKMAHIKQVIEEEERYTSASRDARKMYGDITPGDQTHQDVILLYQNHFKSAFRNMPKEFPSGDKFKVWQLCAAIVQESFDTNKSKITDTMKNDLAEALDLENSTDGQLPEKTRDLHRAFKMMISKMDSDETDFKEKVWNELKHDDKTPTKREAFDFVMDVILNLDPADYEPFLRTGELKDRLKALELHSE